MIRAGFVTGLKIVTSFNETDSVLSWALIARASSFPCSKNPAKLWYVPDKKEDLIA